MTLPGPNRGNMRTGTNMNVPNSGQDPGLHSNHPDPGQSSFPHPHVSARPVFYFHAPPPPPPPFLHYQWPMPFSYNPFAGFPGMGYGMVMPPFPPPPPYMEAPAYILPHPHIQAVDYRRLLHPHVPVPSTPYQNPNQTRRTRLPHTVPVRETVNTEVQTEPPNRGIGDYDEGNLLASSDSGHGTASDSPSSSANSQKQGSAEAENATSPSSNAEDVQVIRTSRGNTIKHSVNILHPTETKTVQSHIRATSETQRSHKNDVGQKNVPPCVNHHCNVWSPASSDSMVPACSSSHQENESAKERRVSIPDILMSWGSGTPQETIMKMAEMAPPQKGQQRTFSKTALEDKKSVYQSQTETQTDPVVTHSTDSDADCVFNSNDSEALAKILKLPFGLYNLFSDSRGDDEKRDELLHTLHKSHKLPDDEEENYDETNPHEDTTEIIPYQINLNSVQRKRRMNESVWSVESLVPYVPTKEWLMQNGIFEPEVIVETREDNQVVNALERRQTRMISTCDFGSMSDSWLDFSTPAERPSIPEEPEIESDIYEKSGPKQGQSMAPSEKSPLSSPTRMQSKIIESPPTAKDVDENRSSEPEANQSPNQNRLISKEQQEKSSSSPEQEVTLLLSFAEQVENSSSDHPIVQNRVDIELEDGECGNKEIGRLEHEEQCVPLAGQKMDKVPPSKGLLVDCAIQCTELQERKCLCEEQRCSRGLNMRQPFEYSDMKRANNGRVEGVYINGHVQKNMRRHGQGRNRGSGKSNGQQETHNQYYGKPGKSKGGNGRNPRY